MRSLVLGLWACSAEGPGGRDEARVYGAVLDRYAALGTSTVEVWDRSWDPGVAAESRADPDWEAFAGALEDLEAVGAETGPLPRPDTRDVQVDLVPLSSAPSEPGSDAYVSYFSRVGFDPGGDLAVVVFGDWSWGDLYGLEREGGEWRVTRSEMLWSYD